MSAWQCHYHRTLWCGTFKRDGLAMTVAFPPLSLGVFVLLLLWRSFDGVGVLHTTMSNDFYYQFSRPFNICCLDDVGTNNFLFLFFWKYLFTKEKGIIIIIIMKKRGRQACHNGLHKPLTLRLVMSRFYSGKHYILDNIHIYMSVH